ncbi:hypothetical protein P7C70_g9513, partial [Phenoliferia sp. Uapishka_3]
LPSNLDHIASTLNVTKSGKLSDLPSLTSLFDLIRSEATSKAPPAQAHSSISPAFSPSQLSYLANAGFVASKPKHSFQIDKSVPPKKVCIVPGCSVFHWLEACTHPGAAQTRIDRKANFGRPKANLAAAGPPLIATLASLGSVLASPTSPISHLEALSPSKFGSIPAATGMSFPGTYTKVTPHPIGGIAGSIMAVGVGDVAFLANLGDGNTRRIIFKKVLHAPNISANLLSISRLAKSGLTTSFGSTSALLTKEDGSLHSRGFINKFNLYSFDGEVVIPRTFASAAISTSSPPLRVWHSRFLHINSRAIQKLERSDQVHGLSISGSGVCVCNSCQLGKATRLPFPISLNRSPHVLYRCYGDLLDFSISSRGGARYLLVLVDDFSRKHWVYPIGLKSETFGKLSAWLSMVQTFTGRKLKQFGADGG